MMAEIRCVHTGEFLGVHRTALTADGRKLGRKVFGSAAGGGVMLDPLAAARPTLVVGEGIETCLAGRQVGLRPMWSLISVGNIGTLPVLDDVIRLTVLAEVDTAPNRPSAAACEKVGARWHAADRSVDFLFPPDGAKDFNDALMMQRGAA
ncbi:toprim domain-containing protein [Methylobacterium currus]|nr:toprim domain-containing protein [Methylobacterium currus]